MWQHVSAKYPPPPLALEWATCHCRRVASCLISRRVNICVSTRAVFVVLLVGVSWRELWHSEEISPQAVTDDCESQASIFYICYITTRSLIHINCFTILTYINVKEKIQTFFGSSFSSAEILVGGREADRK